MLTAEQVAQALEGLPPEQARAIALGVLQRHPARQPRSDTELFSAVLTAIMDAGKPGLSRTELLRRFRDCSADRLDETLVALNRKGYVGLLDSAQPKRGRPPVRFISAWA